jgi:hypothetical protein
MRGRWGWVLVLTLVAGTAWAQPVRNPTRLEFVASPDHAATFPDGSAVVERYEFEIYLLGASSPMTTVNLGKPTPDASGKVTATPSELLGLPVNQTFEARVAAIGPGGAGRSAPSNPFYRAGPPRPATGVVLVAGAP